MFRSMGPTEGRYSEGQAGSTVLAPEPVEKCERLDVFVAVNNERRMCDVFQGGVTSGGWYRSPFLDRDKPILGD
jgi:hypothetical protein